TTASRCCYFVTSFAKFKVASVYLMMSSKMLLLILNYSGENLMSNWINTQEQNVVIFFFFVRYLLIV
ncbi:MAG: hypothetical protein LBJ00_13405, partial [Planctomycetaceae bacterium]|nr:hypothetical protein [Planctomycetaceae bacterium]